MKKHEEIKTLATFVQSLPDSYLRDWLRPALEEFKGAILSDIIPDYEDASRAVASHAASVAFHKNKLTELETKLRETRATLKETEEKLYYANRTFTDLKNAAQGLLMAVGR